MEEYWEIYMKNLEGKPASIQFNAGISMDIEDMKITHPIVAFVKAKLKEVNKDTNLSENEEQEILFMENKLEASMLKFRLGQYVARIISNGYITFVYYIKYTYDWDNFIKFALDEHSSYEITQGHKDDPEWNHYKTLIYPNEKEWQLIQNHKVCDNLKKSGDKLHIKRAIDHKIFFKTEDKKAELIKTLEKEGFTLREDIENEDKVKGINFYRSDKAFYYDIDELTLFLIDLAKKYNAQYDGWETSVIKI